MKKTAIITGASGNLGFAVVEKLVKCGFKIEAVVGSNSKLGFNDYPDLNTYEVDLSDETFSQSFIDKAIAKNGQIDLAICLVGGFSAGTITETNAEKVKKMIQLNFDTAFNIARPVFAQMEKQKKGGQIIFIGSKPALNAMEGKDTLAYSLAKSMIFKLSELINAEGKNKNITSSVIVPSTIDTPVNRANNPNANFADWVTPEQIAQVISFVASEAGKTLRESVLKVYQNS